MVIACPDCGTIQDLPRVSFGSAALCSTCERPLERTAGRSIVAALAFSASTLVLLFPANLLPLMRVSILGMSDESHIWSGVAALWNHQWVIIAVLVAAFVVILPILRFALLSVVLGALSLGFRPDWLGAAFRWTIAIDQWAMPDVFLIGCAVGYSRVDANLPVRIGWGGICFVAAALLSMLSRAALDRRAVWRAIGPESHVSNFGSPAISCTACDYVAPAQAERTPCPRCGQLLAARRPDALVRTAALVIAGIILYVPANVFAMSTAVQLGKSVPHRIIDGIIELFQAGLWPLGVLIFCTSIAIPLFKLAGLGWFLISIRRRSRRRLVLKTKLYRAIDEIGRWSNIDVFTVAVFVPLMQFGAIATAHASAGCTAFLLVVVLTMIASRAFDPRLMWDAARQ